MNGAEPARGPYDRPFTAALIALGPLLLASSALTCWMALGTPGLPPSPGPNDQVLTFMFGVTAALEFILGLGYLVAGLMRHLGHPRAVTVTWTVLVAGFLVPLPGVVMLAWYQWGASKRDAAAYLPEPEGP